MNKVIQVTDRHNVTFDKYQFILQTAYGKKSEDENSERQRYNLKYYKKLSHLCNDLIEDEFKENINLYDLKKLGELFDSLVEKKYTDAEKLLITWFSDFLLKEESEKELIKLRKENAELKQKIKDLKQ